MAIQVGLVGTGYVARVRAQALSADVRSQLVSVTGRDIARSHAFAEAHGLHSVPSWRHLVRDPMLDLVVVATVSALHGEVVEAALNAGKHVVVEYPLSLDVVQAERLVALAADKDLLLHVAHIELLGGLHVAMRSRLPRLGVVSYVNYRTLKPQRPAPMKWTYQSELFGFPFCGALSRVHRLTNLFGPVKLVDCCTQMIRNETDPSYFKSLLSSGRLLFDSGVVAELTYGKGENLWAYHRDVEVQGSLGALAFVGNEGTVTTVEGVEKIAVTPRRGLLVQDTTRVLEHLTVGAPLYVSAAESVYALKVGDALRRASKCGQSVYLEEAFHTKMPGLC